VVRPAPPAIVPAGRTEQIGCSSSSRRCGMRRQRPVVGSVDLALATLEPPELHGLPRGGGSREFVHTRRPWTKGSPRSTTTATRTGAYRSTSSSSRRRDVEHAVGRLLRESDCVRHGPARLLSPPVPGASSCPLPRGALAASSRVPGGRGDGPRLRAGDWSSGRASRPWGSAGAEGFDSYRRNRRRRCPSASWSRCSASRRLRRRATMSAPVLEGPAA